MNTNLLSDRIRIILQEMPGPRYGKQARLARIAGTGRPAVNNWLSGQKSISEENATRICDAFGYRVQWLLSGKGPMWEDEHDNLSEAEAEAEAEVEPRAGSGSRPESEPDEEFFLERVSLDEFRLLSNYRKMQGFQSMFRNMAKSLADKALGEDDKASR